MLFGCIMETKTIQRGIMEKTKMSWFHWSPCRSLNSMEETRFKDEVQYCYFVDYKKSFNLMPLEDLWRYIDEVQVPCEYNMFTISRIFEKMICYVYVANEFSEFSTSTIGVETQTPKDTDYTSIVGTNG